MSHIEEVITNNLDEGCIEKILKKTKVICKATKNELFIKEQMDILEKLHKVTGFDGKLAMFYLENISESDRKFVEDLADDVRKFFKSIVWKCANSEDSDKVWILLIKNVYKHLNHKVSQRAEQKFKKGVVSKKIRIIIEKNVP